MAGNAEDLTRKHKDTPRVCALLICWLAFCLAPAAEGQDFTEWSRSHCKEVVNKATRTGGLSFGKMIGKGLLGQGGTLVALWLTDPASKAVARITQLEERQVAARARAIYRSLRDEDTYSVVMFTNAMHATLGGGADITGAEPERLNSSSNRRISASPPSRIFEGRSQPLQTCWLQFRTEECVPVAILLPSKRDMPHRAKGAHPVFAEARIRP